MTSFQQFEPYCNFHQDILRDIVREGELYLSSQLAVATAADQRAMTLIGFQVTALLATIAGITAMLISKEKIWFSILVGNAVMLGLIISLFQSSVSVRPQLFNFPGNLPENWRIGYWNFSFTQPSGPTLQHSLTEQAYAINCCIKNNNKTLEENAHRIKNSIDITIYTVLVATICIFLYSIILFLKP